MTRMDLTGWGFGVLFVAVTSAACGRTADGPGRDKLTQQNTDERENKSSTAGTAMTAAPSAAASSSSSNASSAGVATAEAVREGTTQSNVGVTTPVSSDTLAAGTTSSSTAGASIAIDSDVEVVAPGRDGGVASSGVTLDSSDAGLGVVPDPYAPRSGSFRMLVYSRTEGWRTSSIPEGQQLVQQIADERGFEITITEDNDEFTKENLDKYEAVFFLDTSGNVLDETEEQAFQDWITNSEGAYIGLDRAVDTEEPWDFYKELTGQYYNGHSRYAAERDVIWSSDALDFPAVRGMPSPWRAPSLWFKFDSIETWSSKPGFKILGWVDYDPNSDVNNRRVPVSFVREWDNFRSFYTVFGYEGKIYQDPWFKRHLEAGILWAVRREHWLE